MPEQPQLPGMPQPSTDILRQFMENESKKIAIQEKRFALEEANQQRQYDYACKALEAQKELLIAQPGENRKSLTRLFWVVAGIIVILLVFFGYCIYMGKEQVVLSVIKYLGTAVLSFVSGLLYGKSKREQPVKSETPYEGLEAATDPS